MNANSYLMLTLWLLQVVFSQGQEYNASACPAAPSQLSKSWAPLLLDSSGLSLTSAQDGSVEPLLILDISISKNYHNVQFNYDAWCDPSHELVVPQTDDVDRLPYLCYTKYSPQIDYTQYCNFTLQEVGDIYEWSGYIVASANVNVSFLGGFEERYLERPMGFIIELDRFVTVSTDIIVKNVCDCNDDSYCQNTDVLATCNGCNCTCSPCFDGGLCSLEVCEPTITCPSNQVLQVAALVDATLDGSVDASSIPSNPSQFGDLYDPDDNLTIFRVINGGSPVAIIADDLLSLQFPDGSTLVQYIVEDPAGNVGGCQFTVSVSDVGDPEITCPDDFLTNNSLPTWPIASATDAYTPNPVVVQSGGPTPSEIYAAGDGSYVIVFTATDAANNSASCNFTVTVDSTPPVCPSLHHDVNTECDDEFGEVNWNVSPPFTDAGSGIDTFAPIGSPNNPLLVECCGSDEEIFNWQVADVAGNVIVCPVTASVTDNCDPVCNLPSQVIINTTAGFSNAFFDINTVLSFSDNVQVSYTTPVFGRLYERGSSPHNFTFYLNDTSGNENQCPTQVIVRDREDPEIFNCPSDLEFFTGNSLYGVDVASSLTAGALFLSHGLDASDNYLLLSFTSDFDTQWPSGNVPIGSHTVTFTAVDASNYANSAECDITFEVIDNDDPQVFCPSDQQFNTDSGEDFTDVIANLINYIGVSAIDNSGSIASSSFGYAVDGGSIVPGQIQVGTDLQHGSVYTIYFTALDAAGNNATCSWELTINDPEKPTYPVCEDLVFNSTADFSSWDDLIAVDNVEVAPLVPGGNDYIYFSTAPSGSIGVTAVVAQVWDTSGNSEFCNYTVTIEGYCGDGILRAVDGEECDGGVGCRANCTCDSPLYEPFDPIENGCYEIPVDPPTPILNCSDESSIIVQQTTDALSVVNWVEADRVKVYTGSSWVEVADCADVVENVSYCLTSNFNPGDSFAVGSHIIRYTATDGRAIEVCEFTVVVQDLAPPSITCPSDITSGTDFRQNYRTLNSIPYSLGIDFVDGPIVPVITYSPQAPVQVDGSYLFPFGVTQVTLTVTDAANNSAGCQYLVTIVDDEDPQLTCPDEITLGTNAGVWYSTVDNSTISLSSLDNVDQVVDLSSLVNPENIPIGVYSREFCHTDNQGNGPVCCNVTIVVVDDEKPVPSCPVDLQGSTGANAGGNNFVEVAWNFSATDNSHDSVNDLYPGNANGPLTYSYVYTGATTGSGATTPAGEASNFNVGVTNVTVIVIDAESLSASCSFLVTVEDTTPPEITCPDDFTAPNYEGTTLQGVTFPLPVVVDNSGAYFLVSDHPSSTFPIGNTKVTYTAFDSNNNNASCFFWVNITDGVDPTADCPDDFTVYSDGGLEANWSLPIFADNVGVSSYNLLTGSPPPVTLTTLGGVTIQYDVYDAAGNNGTCDFIITLVDNKAPEIACPILPLVFNVAPDSNVYNFTWDFSATDDFTTSENLLWTPASKGSSLLSIGTHNFNWVVTDEAGNTSPPCPVTVEIVDVTDPVPVCPLDIEDRVLNASQTSIDGIVYTAIASDNSQGALNISYSPASGSTFGLGVTNVTVTVVDPSGNVGTCTFKVTVLPPYEEPILEAVLTKVKVIELTTPAQAAAGLEVFGAEIEYLTGINYPHVLYDNNASIPHQPSNIITSFEEDPASLPNGCTITGNGYVNCIQTWTMTIEFPDCEPTAETYFLQHKSFCQGDCSYGYKTHVIEIELNAEKYCSVIVDRVKIDATITTHTQAQRIQYDADHAANGFAVLPSNKTQYEGGEVVAGIVECTVRDDKAILRKVHLLAAGREAFEDSARTIKTAEQTLVEDRALVVANDMGEFSDYVWFEYNEYVIDPGTTSFITLTATVEVFYLIAAGQEVGQLRRRMFDFSQEQGSGEYPIRRSLSQTDQEQVTAENAETEGVLFGLGILNTAGAPKIEKSFVLPDWFYAFLVILILISIGVCFCCGAACYGFGWRQKRARSSKNVFASPRKSQPLEGASPYMPVRSVQA